MELKSELGKKRDEHRGDNIKTRTLSKKETSLEQTKTKFPGHTQVDTKKPSVFTHAFSSNFNNFNSKVTEIIYPLNIQKEKKRLIIIVMLQKS